MCFIWAVLSSDINYNILWHPSNPVENKATTDGQFVF